MKRRDLRRSKHPWEIGGGAYFIKNIFLGEKNPRHYLTCFLEKSDSGFLLLRWQEKNEKKFTRFVLIDTDYGYLPYLLSLSNKRQESVPLLPPSSVKKSCLLRTMAPEPKYPEEEDDNLIVDEESFLLTSAPEAGEEQQTKQPNKKKRRRYIDYLSIDDEGEFQDDISDLSSVEKECCRFRLSAVWDAYYAALQAQPLLVKSITAFFLMGAADGIAQMVEHLRGVSHVHFLDMLRVLRFATFGLVGAPWTHFYYDWLDRVLPPTPKPWTWTTFSKSKYDRSLTICGGTSDQVWDRTYTHVFSLDHTVKVCIDQFIQAPLLLALIIIGMGFMEGEGFSTVEHNLKKQYVSTLIANCKFLGI